MATPFADALNIVGPPLHLYLFDETDVSLEDDVGSDPDSPITTKIGTVNSRSTGPLSAGEPSWAADFVDGILHRGGTKLWSSNDFGSLTSGTILFFFKSSSATLQCILGTHPDNNAFRIFLFADGTLHFAVIGGANNRGITTNNSVDYSDGNWHMFVLTCNGTSANKLYVDGAEVSYSTTTGGTGLTDHAWLGDCLALGDFYVGNDTRYLTTDDYPFVGLLSRLALFSGALTGEDVSLLWEASLGNEILPPGSSKTYDDLDLPMTSSVYMAQRLCYRRLQALQREATLVVPANLRAIEFAVSDVLNVAIADVNIASTFRISTWRSEDGSEIEVGLREDDANAYLDPSPALYKVPSSLPTLTPGTVQVPPPTALAATPALEGIQLSWTAPENLLGVHHYAIYSNTSSAWSGATLVGTTLSTTFLHVLASTVTRYYWVRAVDASGYESIRSPDTDTSTVSATFTAGTTAVPSAPQSLGGIDGTPATGQLTGSFSRAGVTVASRVFTATHSGGNLTYSAGADSGEATTHSATGSGTPTLVVTHRHTGSGQTTTLTFTVA